MMAPNSRARGNASISNLTQDSDENDAQDHASQRSLNNSINHIAFSNASREPSSRTGIVNAESSTLGLQFSDASVATSIASSQASSRVSLSQQRQKKYPWEKGAATSLLGARPSDPNRSRRGEGASSWGTRDATTPASARSVTASGSTPPRQMHANRSMHVHSDMKANMGATDRLELSTHSTHSRTRYASFDTRPQARPAKPVAAFSFRSPNSAHFRDKPHRASNNQAEPIPITASAVLSSLVGYSVSPVPPKKFHRESDPPQEKPPTLASLFRLHEEEAEGFEDVKVRQGIELARQTQKLTQKSNYEVDAPPVNNLMVLPEVQGQGLEGEQWKIPNKGEELDQSSYSDAASSRSLDSMDDLMHSEYMGRFLDRENQPNLQESIASLEPGAQADVEIFDAAQEVRDAEEQLENLDHAGAVITSFNRMLEQTKLNPRRNQYAMQKDMPSLRSFGSIHAESMKDLIIDENLAWKTFIHGVMLSVESDVYPPQTKLTDIFKWSEKENVDKVERLRFQTTDGNEKDSKRKRVSRADVLFKLSKVTDLLVPSADSESNGTDVGVERTLVDVTVPNSTLAKGEGAPGLQKPVPGNSEPVDQKRSVDDQDINGEDPSPNSALQGAGRLHPDSSSLRVLSSVDSPAGDEFGSRQQSNSKVVELSGENARGRDSLAVNDVVPNFAQGDMTTLAEVLDAGEVADKQTYISIDQERRNPENLCLSRSNDEQAISTSSVLTNVKADKIYKKKSKLAENESTPTNESGQKSSLVATNLAGGNDEKIENDTCRDDKETMLSATQIPLNSLEPSPEVNVPEFINGWILSAITTPSSKNTVDKDSIGEDFSLTNNVLTMKEPSVSLKPLATAKAVQKEDRMRRPKLSNGIPETSASTVSARESKNRERKQKKLSGDGERRGRTVGGSVRSSGSAGQGPDLNDGQHPKPESVRRSKRTPEPGPQRVKPDFVTASNKSSSFRRSDVDGIGAEPAPPRRVSSHDPNKSLATTPLKKEVAILDDYGQGEVPLPASTVYDDDPFKSLSISPEEVLAALMKGGATRKAQKASPLASEMKPGASKSFQTSLPKSKGAKNGTNQADKSARSLIPLVGHKPSRQLADSMAVSSNVTSARSISNLDHAAHVEPRRPRSSKAHKSKRSGRTSNSLTSDDDSIEFNRPTFRKAPSRRSITVPNTLAKTSNARDQKRSTGRAITSTLKGPFSGQEKEISVPSSEQSKEVESLQIRDSQNGKYPATPSSVGSATGDLPNAQINLERKSSKRRSADSNFGKGATKDAKSTLEGAHKLSQRKERSARSSRSPTASTGLISAKTPDLVAEKI